MLTVTDQFCGAGGSSLAAHHLGLEVQLAMNHWQLAIETHNTNFPDTEHDCADVSQTDPRRYWGTDVLLTSPECTNHTVAKGVRRRKKQMSLFNQDQIDPAAERSRATMWDVPRFAEIHRYQFIIVENVVDARQWILFDDWIRTMHTLGYDHHIVYMNSMFAHMDPRQVKTHWDYAPQSRDRMYVVFWRKGNKRPNLEFQPLANCPSGCGLVEAVQSFKNTSSVRKMGGRWGRYGAQYIYICPKCHEEVTPYHFAALNAIDLTDPGERIGDRSRPLKPKTINRIKQGLAQYGSQMLVMETAFGGGDDNRSRPATDPLFTQTTRQTLAVVSPVMIQLRKNQDSRSVIQPLSTLLAGANHHGLLQLQPFMMSYYGANGNHTSVDEAMKSVTALDRHCLVSPPVVTVNYSPGYSKSSADALATITSTDHHSLICPPFLLGYANQEGPAKGSDDPLRTIHTENGQGVVQYGRDFNAEDCYFRMLQPHELSRGMAFPDEYVVLGTKRDQVRQYGNAVTPVAPRQILARCVEAIS